MSFLGKIFGGKKEEKGPTTHEAIQKLRETEELLVKKQEFLEKKIDLEIQTARKNGTKNKRGILFRTFIILHLEYLRRVPFDITSLLVSLA